MYDDIVVDVVVVVVIATRTVGMVLYTMNVWMMPYQEE